MGATTEHDRVKDALAEVDFPAHRDELVEAGQSAGADGETVRALRAMPPVEYENIGQVLASVPAADAGGASGADKAAARRHHTHDRLAEREKDVPANPIAEELGENRGS